MRSLTVKTPSHGKNVVVVVFLFVLIIDEGKLSEGDFLLIRTFSIILLFSIRSRRTNRKSKKKQRIIFFVIVVCADILPSMLMNKIDDTI